MATSKGFDSEILTALAENDAAQVTALLHELRADGGDINKIMSTNYVNAACAHNCDDDILQELIAAGVAQENKLQDLNPAFFQAVVDEDQGLIKRFLEARADVNIMGVNKANCPLEAAAPHAALSSGKSREVAMPLLCAALDSYYYNSTSQVIVKALLCRSDIDLRQADEQGNTALSYAVAFGTRELLDCLKKIDPKIFAEYPNKNLCQIALYNSNAETLKHVLKNKLADPNEISTITGKDPLDILFAAHNYWAFDVDKWEAARADDDSDGQILKDMYSTLVRYKAKSSARHEDLFTEATQLRNAFIIPDRTHERE